jgi:SRR1
MKVTEEIINPSPLLSIEGSRDFFLTSQCQWEESESCKRLVSTIEALPTPIKATKIVAFACGSITENSESLARCSAFQHALILTLRKVLSQKQSHLNDLTCYAQEPAYSSTDKSVLEEFGIKVVDDPEGFLMVDDSAVVLSFAPGIPVKQIVSDLANPAAMIWDAVDLNNPVDSL